MNEAGAKPCEENIIITFLTITSSYYYYSHIFFKFFAIAGASERQTDRQRQRDRDRDTQRDRQTDRQTLSETG